MSFEYISVEEAMEQSGLRMVVVGNVPSGWGEAAKGIFHIKGLPWAAVRLRYDSEPLKAWVPRLSGPAVFYDKEPRREGWAEILLLAERLAPTPSLVPADPTERALMFGIAHEICGEAGLGWARSLQLVHAGLHGAGGFVEPIAKYLGRKYEYRTEQANAVGPRVVALLTMLATRLRAQRVAGSAYYVGSTLTAVDVYSAAFMAMFVPLPPEQCAMNEGTRAAFETLDAPTKAALDPILLEHRDMLYARHLVLPLSL